jgi:LysR family hydrogen peroxide-inducible transcriptional activator
MEMHQLQYFVKAAELENFTRAAEYCLVSQPSLSQQIGKLEAELGQPLFERRGRRVVLTDAGRILLEYAHKVLALAEEAKSRIADQDRTGSGRVSVAAIPTVGPYLLPHILKKFARVCPNAQLVVHEEPTEQAMRMCANGEVDAVLLALPVEEPQLATEPLLRDELLVCMERSHPLAAHAQISLNDLKDEGFILLNETHCLNGDVLALCRQGSFRPRVTCRSSQLSTVQQMIALGYGISLLPRLAAECDTSKQRVYRPLVGQPHRVVALAWSPRRHQTRLATRLLETIRTYANSQSRAAPMPARR